MNRTTIGRGILALVISCLAAAKIVAGFYKAASQTAAGNLAGAAGTALGTAIVVLLAFGVVVDDKQANGSDLSPFDAEY